MFIKKNNPLAALISFGAAAVFSGSTFAQLEEIVVTAQKRSENINDVGLSIAAVSGTKLAEQKLTSLEEISSAVPGLVYSTSTANTPIFTLRGIGFNEQSLGAYPATSLYLDEAPMPFPVLASHAAYDLERVEVLKGPQGILFGQNSTGGAINFIAAKPGDELEAGADVSYSRFNKVEMNGYVSGPLTDTVGARLAVTGVNSDDWQRSTSRDDENGAEEYQAARLILTFEPTDTASYLVNINGWNDKSDPQAQQFIARNPQIPFDPAIGAPPSTFQPLLDQPFSPEDPRAADWSTSMKPSSDREFAQFIVRGDWELSETMTLTALTTYADFEQSQTTDGDGSPLISFDLSDSEANIETSITEIRLTGDQDMASWIIGANYEKSDTLEDQVLRYIDNTNYTASNLFIHGSGIRNEQEIDSYAFFANSDFHVTDALTAKVGARYTETTIDVNSCNYAALNLPGAIVLDPSTGQVNIDANGEGRNVASLFNLLGSLFNTTGQPFTPIGGYPDCYTLNFDGIPGQEYVDTLEEDNVSWRFGLDYQLNDDTLLYANVSKGYKAGSFPSLAASTFLQYQPVTQESVLAYEAGFKASLAENRVQLNAAAFYYEYEDKQLRTKLLEPIFGFLDILANVPESEIYGVEMDITAMLTDSLTLTASATYLDSEVKNYQGVSITSQAAPNPNTGLLELVDGLENFSGDPIPFTPELTYALDLDYRIPLANGGEVFSGINVTGQSESDAAFGGGRLFYNDALIARGAGSITPLFNEIDSYAVWGARLGYQSADGHWKVMLWGKNLADEYYVTNVVASSDSTSRFVGRPRTYGITLGYTY